MRLKMGKMLTLTSLTLICPVMATSALADSKFVLTAEVMEWGMMKKAPVGMEFAELASCEHSAGQFQLSLNNLMLTGMVDRSEIRFSCEEKRLLSGPVIN